MLSKWHVESKLKLFVINKRWGIRNNAFDNWSAVIVHRCTKGDIGHIHDLKRNNNKCDMCGTIVPDEVQALWLLRTYTEHDERWMEQKGESSC